MEVGGQLGVREAHSFQIEESFTALTADCPISITPGWAKRPPIGSMYGKSNIHFYKDFIKEMFMAGVAKNGNKKGPGRMLEELKNKYDCRFDLPTETEIRNEISKLNKSLTQSSIGPKPVISIFNHTHVNFLENLILSNSNVMPKEAVKAFQETFQGDSDKLISNKQGHHGMASCTLCQCAQAISKT